MNIWLFLSRSPARISRAFVAFDFEVELKNDDRTEKKKKALIIHRARPLLWPLADKRFLGHSIDWEARKIADLIRQHGFDVTAITGWSPLIDQMKKSDDLYDLIVDENGNLPGFLHLLKDSGISLLYLTGSYPRFQNAQEMGCVQNLNARRNCKYVPKRLLKTDAFDISLDLADGVLLVGNEVTLNTYPDRYRGKIDTVRVSASVTVEKEEQYIVPPEKEFLWFFGEGVVHKGLDLLLEVFARNPAWTLNVVGPVLKESDFLQIYHRELFETKNIRLHGVMVPSSPEFLSIINRCFAFIAPAVSEGISPAVATCLTTGLFPIISRNTGITLPASAGIYLTDHSEEAIERAIGKTLELSESDLYEQIVRCRDFAKDHFTRQHFTSDVDKFLTGKV